MNSSKRVMFILNPKAGHGLNEDIIVVAGKILSKNFGECIFKKTEFVGHATTLAAEAVKDKIDLVVCVGGDGTVNETAQALKGSETSLAIVPTGSGNGLARHLRIPMNYKRAIGLINDGKKFAIDTFLVNDRFAVNLAGVGFDALVAHRFAALKVRGLQSYIKTVIRSISDFEEMKFTDVSGQQQKAWLMCIANSSQFGNNARIAPAAQVNDGMLDVVMIKRPSVLKMIPFAVKMFNGKLETSNSYRCIRVKKYSVDFEKEQPMHIDGEPAGMASSVEVQLIPQSLNIIIP
ncbi:MAG: diacylglycerol kinase family lipid kinase [Bacteroidia bacterium]|nr:diacylglycerol kinase family lipid kinase [Bacteroidia bacterium]MBP7715109.1 diacylglycerol kinase family lipid kinase [Bacteroidia bacterium]HOZ90229.1 diacylglycerol kinase family lipid kinase [Bacteroidia bacterium]HQW17926.1 diacylglycerol kinase family lipid kinase [Bacteroidia bacterium]HQW49245.1 diacylglycerol kinase family lipid kinase [Bacteroidia bacterium]